ncbi:hypothetical protein UACE39S_00996 [Ureibacillus acetophenoni]
MTVKKKRGRPSGKVKTSKIEIIIEPEIKEQFMEIVHNNNEYCSVLIREWIIDYIVKNEKQV